LNYLIALFRWRRTRTSHGGLSGWVKGCASAAKSRKREGIADLGRRRCWASSVAARVEFVEPKLAPRPACSPIRPHRIQDTQPILQSYMTARRTHSVSFHLWRHDSMKWGRIFASLFRKSGGREGQVSFRIQFWIRVRIFCCNEHAARGLAAEVVYSILRGWIEDTARIPCGGPSTRIPTGSR